MKTFFILSLFFLFQNNGFSQDHKLDHVSAAVTTLHTAFPFASFGKLFTGEFHPGVEIGTGFNWNSKPRRDWFQSFQFGYSYHRFVQHSLALYSEAGYRYKFLKTFAAETKLGVGYLHAIPIGKIFKLREDGNYERKTNLGRSQAMASFSVGVNKKIAEKGVAVFIQYTQRLQFPFIKSYVPLLPSNILVAGVKIPFQQKVSTH